MSRYTVIGASGFVGARLVTALKAAGHEVFAPTRDNDGLFTRDLFAAHLVRLAAASRVRNRPMSVAVLRVADRPEVIAARASGWLDRAIPQIGSSYQYALSLLGPKYGLDLSSIKYTAVQSMPNIGSAVAGDKADAGILNTAVTMPLLDRGQIKLLAWVGDEAPFQIAGLWTSTKLANSNKD